MVTAAADGAASMPWGIVLRCTRCLSSMSSRLFRVNGFGRTSSIPVTNQSTGPTDIKHDEHTVLEVELNVVTSNVGRHGNDWSSVELADEVAG